MADPPLPEHLFPGWLQSLVTFVIVGYVAITTAQWLGEVGVIPSGIRSVFIVVLMYGIPVLTLIITMAEWWRWPPVNDVRFE